VKIKVEKIDMTDPRYQQERALRNEILLRPIGLPDFGWEMKDGASMHFIAYDQDAENQNVVGCVLLHQLSDISVGQLMQMAVKSNLQRAGIGKKMVKVLLNEARSAGLKQVFCHAREQAIPFYSLCGFIESGAYFEEVGIKHVKMTISL
tara:strand:- start:42 stop:488 length:447 start_codon:yes stop_codon:yes gene_type:complete